MEYSEALQLARSIWETSWMYFTKLVPHPVADVVQLLNRLEDQPATNGGRIVGGVPRAARSTCLTAACTAGHRCERRGRAC